MIRIPSFVAAVVVAGAFVAGPARAADVFRGAEVYRMHCASCHGPSGISVMPGAPNLARGEGLMMPDVQLVASVQRGRNAMPGYLGILNDRDIYNVIAYARTLR